MHTSGKLTLTNGLHRQLDRVNHWVVVNRGTSKYGKNTANDGVWKSQLNLSGHKFSQDQRKSLLLLSRSDIGSRIFLVD